MKKFVLGPALAALAMFIWGFLYWGLLTLPYKALKATNQTVAASALNAAFPVSGTYIVPDPRLDPKAMAEALKTGPLATVHIRKGGVDSMPPSQLLYGFLHEYVSCLLLALLLWKAAPGLPSYGCRVMFSVAIGVLIGFFSHFSAVIWWHEPCVWHLMGVIYDVVAWLLAGLILAKFVTPDPVIAPPAA